jgi:hypothetical protein
MPMALTVSDTANAESGGRTPWSARDALVPLFARGMMFLPPSKGRPGGRPRTRAFALPFTRLPGNEKIK